MTTSVSVVSFLIVFRQQWSSMAQRNTMYRYQVLATQIILPFLFWQIYPPVTFFTFHYFPPLCLFSFSCSPAFHQLIIPVFLSICISIIICQFAVTMVGIQIPVSTSLFFCGFSFHINKACFFSSSCLPQCLTYRYLFHLTLPGCT